MKPIFTFLFITCATIIYAQETIPYDLIVSQENYTELENDTVLNMSEWDNESLVINAPYGYNFMAHALVSLEQVGSATTFIASSFNGADLNFLVPYGIDVINASLVSDTDSSTISYSTEITPDDTVFVVQFSNLAFFNEIEEGETDGRVNFQLRFFQGSDAFQITFGPSSIADENVAFGEFTGPPIMFSSAITTVVDPEQEDSVHYNYSEMYYLSGDPNDPELLATNQSLIYYTEDTMYIAQEEYLSGQPQVGTTYTFVPNISTGIVENVDYDFNVYPSPTKDFLNIQLPEGMRKEIIIYNTVGQKVMAFYANPRETFKRIDVHNLVPGIYLIHAGDETRKFVKE